MFELTESAERQLKRYFADKEASAIRVYLAQGGWSGPKLSLALDEPRNTDDSFEAGGFTFLIEKELLQQTGAIRVDLTYFGFSVDSEKPIASAGGGCGGSCSTASNSSGGCTC